MSSEGRKAGGPRLTVVGSDDAEGPAGSPVHDLLESIETGAGGTGEGLPPGSHDQPEPNADGEVREASPSATIEETPEQAERRQRIRVLEAVIFASAEPLDEVRLETYLRPGEALRPLLDELQALYAGRGVGLVHIAGKWAFRTAEDLSWALERHAKLERRLSKAALETLAIVAYHQPVTRAEIEEVRGVTISKGTLDVLMEVGWVRPRGRRRAPGKPITYGTTDKFLEHFGLASIRDLPGLADLKASGLLDSTLPPDFKMPEPTEVAALMPDELPLEDAGEGDEQLQGVLSFEEEPLDDDEARDDVVRDERVVDDDVHGQPSIDAEAPKGSDEA